MPAKQLGMHRNFEMRFLAALRLALIKGQDVVIDVLASDLDHVAPFRDVGFDALGDCLGRAGFGIDALQEGKVRIVAVYSDVPTFRNMTVRMHVANLNFLTSKRDVVDRFLKAGAETIDWMYAGPEAIAVSPFPR